MRQRERRRKVVHARAADDRQAAPRDPPHGLVADAQVGDELPPHAVEEFDGVVLGFFVWERGV